MTGATITTGVTLDAWDDTSVTIDGERIPTGPERIMAVHTGRVVLVQPRPDTPNATPTAPASLLERSAVASPDTGASRAGVGSTPAPATPSHTHEEAPALPAQQPGA